MSVKVSQYQANVRLDSESHQGEEYFELTPIYQETYIKAANGDSSDKFGSSVSLSGETLAVGALYEDSNHNTITNGATASQNNSGYYSGAVYIYRRSGVNWAQEAYIKAANAQQYDFFGSSVSLSGDTLAVGAKEEDSNQTTITNGTTARSDNSASYSGAVYVYRIMGRMHDPHIRIGSVTHASVTLEWENNLGTASRVKIAPTVIGSASAAANCEVGIVLDADATNYTYGDLNSNSKYGFRVFAFDGTTTTKGALIWADTA